MPVAPQARGSRHKSQRVQGPARSVWSVPAARQPGMRCSGLCGDACGQPEAPTSAKRGALLRGGLCGHLAQGWDVREGGCGVTGGATCAHRTAAGRALGCPGLARALPARLGVAGWRCCARVRGQSAGQKAVRHRGFPGDHSSQY